MTVMVKLFSILHTAKLSIVFLIVALAGCVGGDVNIVPTLATGSELKADQGLVVARVVNLSAYPLPFNQLTIAAENVNESGGFKPERLIALPGRLKQSAVFASGVKQGVYALSSIRSFYSNGEAYYSRSAGTDAKFGTFEVKPGHVTDLGTLAYYPKSEGDKYLNTIVRVPGEAQDEILSQYFPFYNDQEKPILTWNQDGFEEDRETLYASVAQNPVTYDKHYLAPNGSLFFLGGLGVITERTGNGEWKLDAVDTNLSLNAIAQNSTGDRVVGGEEGRLFWKSVGGEWVDVSLDPKYTVIELFFNARDQLQVIIQYRDTLEVRQAIAAGPPRQWKELNRYAYLTGWLTAPRKSLPSSRRSNNPHRVVGVDLLEEQGTSFMTVFTVPINSDSPFIATSKHVYTYNSQTWHVTEAPRKPAVTTAIAAGASQLGIKIPGFWSWSGQTQFFRFDTVEKNGKKYQRA